MLSTPPVTFETVMILSLGSGLDFFTGALLPNFQKTVNRELLNKEVQQLERYPQHRTYEISRLA